MQKGVRLQGALPSDQGLCSWSPLGTLPLHPCYRFAIRACHVPPPHKLWAPDPPVSKKATLLKSQSTIHFQLKSKRKNLSWKNIQSDETFQVGRIRLTWSVKWTSDTIAVLVFGALQLYCQSPQQRRQRCISMTLSSVVKRILRKPALSLASLLDGRSQSIRYIYTVNRKKTHTKMLFDIQDQNHQTKTKTKTRAVLKHACIMASVEWGVN